MPRSSTGEDAGPFRGRGSSRAARHQHQGRQVDQHDRATAEHCTGDGGDANEVDVPTEVVGYTAADASDHLL
jgi:hypothetical protein